LTAPPAARNDRSYNVELCRGLWHRAARRGRIVPTASSCCCGFRYRARLQMTHRQPHDDIAVCSTRLVHPQSKSAPSGVGARAGAVDAHLQRSVVARQDDLRGLRLVPPPSSVMALTMFALAVVALVWAGTTCDGGY